VTGRRVAGGPTSIMGLLPCSREGPARFKKTAIPCEDGANGCTAYLHIG
jgi:hypothetical protein